MNKTRATLVAAVLAAGWPLGVLGQGGLNRIENGTFDFGVLPWGVAAGSQVTWDTWDATTACTGSARAQGAAVFSNCFPVTGGEQLEIQLSYSENQSSDTFAFLRLATDAGCSLAGAVGSDGAFIESVAGQFVHLVAVHPSATFASLRFADQGTGELSILVDDVHVGPLGRLFADDFESGTQCHWIVD